MTAVVVCLAFLAPASVACLYYFVLTTLGWGPRPTAVPPAPRHTFAVLIPAHDEELGLPTTLRSVWAADYPADRVRVLVVADNCTDRTADIARRLGADCLERVDPANRGKGYALATAVPHALAGNPDAVLVLDADCELAPDALRKIDAALAAGAKAVQTARVPRNPGDGPAAAVSAVGSAIENAVSAGRCRLGASAALRGSGMAFTRGLLERHPWASVGLTEDAEYGTVLARAGVRVWFLSDVVVSGEVPTDAATLTRQRKRWRATLFARGPGVFARWLASKPLVLAHLLLATLVVGGLSSQVPAGLPVWAGVLLALTAVVYVRAMRRSKVKCRGIGTAVGVVARLAWVTLVGFADRGRAWERTPRVAEADRA